MDGHKQGPWGVGWRMKMKVLGTTATTRIRKTMVMMMEMKMKVMGEKRLLGTTPTPPDWPFPLWLPHTLHYPFSSSDARHSKYSFPVFFPIFFFYIILIFFPWFSVACTLLTPFLSSSTPLTHSYDFLSSRYSFFPLYSGGGASQACPHVLMPHIQKITLGVVQI